MANVTRHRFASGKTDGPDATQVQPSNWNDGHVYTGGAAGDVLTRDPTDATYGAKWTTPTPIGAWVAVPFNAGDFTAGDGASWIVTSGNVLQFDYSLVGRRMFLDFLLVQTSINIPTGTLVLRIPGGYVPARAAVNAVGLAWNNVSVGDAYAYAQAGIPDLWFRRAAASVQWAASSGDTHLQGQIDFAI